MKNKESLENFKETAAMLKETVQPVCDFFHRIANEKHKEEWLYFLFPIVLLVVSAKHGHNCFLKANAILSLLYGSVMIVYPEALVSITFQGELDSGMRFMCSLYGAYQLGSIFFPLFLINSKDKSIFISYYWSKIIENYLIIVECLIAVQAGLRWNHKLLCYACSSSVCIAFLMLYFLRQSTHKRSQFHFKLFQVNRIAKIDFFLLLSSGIMMIGYPNTVLGNFGVNNIHEGHQTMCRIAGIIVFGMCIQSFCCPSFLFEVDKKRFFQARISFWFMEVLMGLFGFYCLKHLTIKTLTTYFASVTVYGFILFYGLYLCEAQLGEYQHQVDISMMESEASFNASRNSVDAEPLNSEDSFEKKDN